MRRHAATVCFAFALGIAPHVTAMAQQATTNSNTKVITFPSGDRYETSEDQPNNFTWTFTDGSRLEHRGGIGVVTFADGSRVELTDKGRTFIDAAGQRTKEAVLQPRLINAGNQAEWYPEEARKNLLTGTTIIGFIIDTDGRIKNTQIASSSGSNVLDKASMDFVLSRRYIPSMAGSRPFQSPSYITVVWKLQ